MTDKPNNKFLMIITVLVLIGGIYLISVNTTSQVLQSNVEPISTSTESTSSNSVKANDTAKTTVNTATTTEVLAKTVSGKVNTTEIGGSGLSASDGMSISTVNTLGSFFGLPVAQDKLSVIVIKDSNAKTRAYAVYIPGQDPHISIDANSTAVATLIDPTADIATAKKELAIINNLTCLPAYVSYLKSQLPTHTIEDIAKATNSNDPSNPQVACVQEITNIVRAQASSTQAK
jgi:hypothetical protein